MMKTGKATPPNDTHQEPAEIAPSSGGVSARRLLPAVAA